MLFAIHRENRGGYEFFYDDFKNRAGKIRQVSDPSGSYGFAYDNVGRLIGTTTQYSFLPGVTYTNAYGYDAASNRTSFTAPDGSITAYQYDSLNRLAALSNPLSGQFTFGYDALSRRTALNRPNGVSTSYTYDSLSRLLSVLHRLETKHESIGDTLSRWVVIAPEVELVSNTGKGEPFNFTVVVLATPTSFFKMIELP